MPFSTSTRVARLQKILQEKKLDALLIRDEKNRFYLSNFAASEGVVLVTREKAFFFLDGRYYQLGKKSVRGMNILLFQSDLGTLTQTIRQAGLKKIGYEENKFSGMFLEKIKQEAKIKELVPTRDIGLEVRMVKDTQEITYIQKACRLSDAILIAAKRKIKVGMTERDIHILLKKIALDHGVLDWSFTPIIGINAGASYPHYMLMNDRKKLKRGDVLLIDMGAPCSQYQSDMTRTFFIGAPSARLASQYETLLRIQKNTIQQIQAGESIGSSLKVFEKTMQQAGLLRFMSHALGHGVGLDVHELPHLSTQNKQPWQKNMVIAIEPGIYFPGKYGMRIEDTCVVTEKKAIPLTKTPKELKDCIL